MYVLGPGVQFPPPELAGEDGFLAIGGKLDPEWLLLAYSNGIFPWYNDDEPICWWSPDPRFVLFPGELNISKSMKAALRSGRFRFTTDTSFSSVIRHCATISRKGQEGTWINAKLLEAYIRMHELGHAHSAETWFNDQLVGGLYGVRVGNIFFGESMFSLVPNASKFAFINYVALLMKENIRLIDCQVYTSHLQSLGARMIPRADFLRIIKADIGA